MDPNETQDIAFDQAQQDAVAREAACDWDDREDGLVHNHGWACSERGAPAHC